MQNAVSEIMSTKLEMIDITATAQEAAKKMNDKRISSVLVIDKNKKNKEVPIGIVTEKDLVHRICAPGVSSKEISVSDIMSSPIETIEAEASVESAADVMLSNKIRHLLVVVGESQRPVGIIAPTDLNKYLTANIDMDEVNARILRAIKAEQEEEQAQES